MESMSGFTANGQSGDEFASSEINAEWRMKWVSRILVLITVILLIVWELALRGR